jgi:hypothetical protein
MITPLTHGTSETIPADGLQGQDSASVSRFPLARAPVSNVSASQAPQARPDPQAVPYPVVGSTRQEKTARDGTRENSDPSPILLGILGPADRAINLLVREIEKNMSEAKKTAALSPRLLDANTGMFVFAHGNEDDRERHFKSNIEPHKNVSWTSNLATVKKINEIQFGDSVVRDKFRDFDNNFMAMKVKDSYIGTIIHKNAQSQFGGDGINYIALIACYGKNQAPNVAEASRTPVVAFDTMLSANRSGHIRIPAVNTDDGPVNRLWIFYPDSRSKTVRLDSGNDLVGADHYVSVAQLDRIIRANL